ncbi:MAG TPA: VCBS repeat-containing protein [Acidimicrobiia bacterium]|nr:VCBS repeat-containing protein [Acidimicrobiia bacterium]
MRSAIWHRAARVGAMGAILAVLIAMTGGIALGAFSTSAARDVTVSLGATDAPASVACDSGAPSAAVTWPVNDPFASYEVERANGRVNGSWTAAATVAEGSYTDAARGLWSYRVRSARGAGWRSAWTATAGPCQVLSDASLGDAEMTIIGAAPDDRIGNDQGAFPAGDVNGDGHDDVLVGAHLSDPSGSASGTAYVVFGNGTSAPVDLAALGARGVRFTGSTASAWVGRRVAPAGDVNGDGYDDVLVGAEAANVNGVNSGAAYVVFGRAAMTDLVLSGGLGTAGFRMAGPEAGARVSQVAGAGDVNGDGFDDVVVGSHLADANGADSGAAYVVYGSPTPTNLTLSATMGSAGFRIAGPHAGAMAGYALAAGDDVDGDGRDDLAIGVPYANTNGTSAGGAYVVFGVASPVNVTLSDAMGVAGFRVAGPAPGVEAGRSVVLTDLDGDGDAELAIDAQLDDTAGTDAGAVFIVLGGTGGNLTLTSPMGPRGFVIHGAAAGDLTGRHLGRAGDHDGDGVGDLAIGAYASDTGGTDSGAAFVVLGTPTPSDLALAGPRDGRAVRYGGAGAGDAAGRSVGHADIDGDGRIDLVVAASSADPAGRTDAGIVYVLLGTQP